MPPGAGIHSRYSGLRIQGTANSPTSAALLHIEAEQAILYFTIFSSNYQDIFYILRKKQKNFHRVR